MKLTIDNQVLEIDRDVSIYQAAQRVGVDIPVLCYKEGYQHFTSCMMCMVKDKTSGKTIPACSARAMEGMEIETDNDEIRAFRKTTLELLLSDHVGDCEAPCQRVCTVHFEIPKMIREIKANQMEAAIATIRRDMAIPAILERLCHAPCEKGCRRSKHDEGLSIRELTRFVADWDLARDHPFVPPRQSATGKRVAVIGAGATGLSAAYHLALEGHSCAVFEKRDRVGGRIETEFKTPAVPDWVWQGELRVLRALGIEFRMHTEVGPALPFLAEEREKTELSDSCSGAQSNNNVKAMVSLNELREEYSAVIFAGGASDLAALQALGLPLAGKKLKINPSTSMTDLEGVFAGGSVLKGGQPLARSVFAGKSMACLVTQYLAGKPLTGLPELYNHSMGRLLEGELEMFMSGAHPVSRLKSEGLESNNSFDQAVAQTECTRCMHCDCRKNHDCKLRFYSQQYGAAQTSFKGEERAKHIHINQKAGAVYEPGKCVKCGLCVRITQAEGEPFGFTFIGRGFDVKPGISLNKSLAQGLEKTALMVVEACPTGALSRNES